MKTLKAIAPFASLTLFLIQIARNKDLVEGLRLDWEAVYIAGAFVSALVIVVLYARVARNTLLTVVPSYRFRGMHRRIEYCRWKVEFNVGHVGKVDTSHSQAIKRARLFDDLERLGIKVPELDAAPKTLLRFLGVMSLTSERGELDDAVEFSKLEQS